MDFRQRLQKASDRGKRVRDAKVAEEAAKALSEEECRRLYSNYRLSLSEYIERCLQQLAESIPGFRIETIVDESGWGAAVSRDDISIVQRQRTNFFSRLLIVISPHNQYHVLEVVAKGTIRNKETFSRTHFQRLADIDEDSFRELIELWVLDYAEEFAAAG